MEKVKRFFGRVFSFLKRNKYSSFFVFVAVVVTTIFLWSSYSDLGNSFFNAPDLKLKEKVVKEVKVRAPLSGEMVSSDLAERRPLAIVVENHTDARPQSGLDKASIVYETLAESGISRFLAIYQEKDASEVGPVRSARVQFVNWAKELTAVFAHAGGSVAALEMIQDLDILDFNHNTTDFWRDNSRFAPHNLYTDTEKVREGGVEKGYSEKKKIDPFEFKDDVDEEERPESQTITIDLSSSSYEVKYEYDKEKNDYKRIIAGKPHTDKVSGKQLRVKNIIVQYTTIRDRVGTLDTQVQAIGDGDTEYFQDGVRKVGTWEKTSASSRTKYMDEDGKEIELNVGQTWITVVRTTTNVTVE